MRFKYLLKFKNVKTVLYYYKFLLISLFQNYRIILLVCFHLSTIAEILLFPQNPAAAIDRDAFNRAIDLEYDRIRDFLILHYHATQRDDSPFWNHVRTMEVPESLSEKMALFRKRGRVARYREGLFLEPSWLAVYFGQRIVPTGYDQRADGPDDGALARALDQLRQEVAAAAAALPDQSVYLERVGALA